MKALWLGLALWGCGEIERADLQVLPSPDDFATEVQPLLITLNCSFGGGCHETGVGELTIKAATDPGALDTSFQSVKGAADLEAPAESRVIQAVLAENAASQHSPPACFRQDGCAYRKLVAWLSWKAEGDVRPQDIDCDPAPEGCFK